MQSGNLGGGLGSGMGFGAAGMGGNPITQFLGGLFVDSGSPFGAGMDQLQKYYKIAQNAQNPFLQAGQQGLGNFQNWLSTMQDPTKFINSTMNNYQQSPWAQFEQQQAMRAGQAAGSASGLTGSSPLMQQMQQNASNISSQDMQNWLGNVLGINSQYGQGQLGLAGMGQNSANMLSQLAQNMGTNMAQGAYGQQAGQNQDVMNMIGGGLGIAAMFL